MTVTTEVFYNGNGSQVQFTFPFDYIDQSHVTVGILNVTSGLYEEKVQDDPTYGWFLANASTVEFKVAPPVPTSADPNIKIYRETDSDDPYAVFTPGSPIKAFDLNDNFEQSIYIAQESASVSARAEQIVQTVEALSVQTKAIADQAAVDSSTALSTSQAAVSAANSANSTANIALTTANKSISDAANAVVQATTANNNATAANVKAAEAEADAAQAVSDAASAESAATTAASTANVASNTASTAVSTANAANSNATSALSIASTANTTASTADGKANQAIADAAQAVVTANAAADSVSQAVLFEQVANVAAIPTSPDDNDAIKVVDSTGIESFTPLLALPAGFVGDSGLNISLVYRSAGASWNYISYDANDPDNRYINPTDAVGLIRRDGSVAYTAQQAFANGTLALPSINFGAGKGINSTATDLSLVFGGASRAVFNSAGLSVTGDLAVTGTVDGRNVAADGVKLDSIESGATADQTASEILTLIKTVDGSGSGLNADLLDGQSSAYYRNYNNLTNAPFTPTKTSELTNDAGFITGSVPISTFNNNVGYLTGIPNDSVTPAKLDRSYVEGINVTDFGAVGDGVTDDTAAIQAALNAVSPSLVVGMGGVTLNIPQGQYRITSTLTCSNTGQVLLRGEGKYRSVLQWDAPSPGLMLDCGAWGLDLENIQINGRPSNGDLYRAGDEGIRSLGVQRFSNTFITGFETQLVWAGGYYHSFNNCDFVRFGTHWKDLEAYNVSYSQCRWSIFDNGLDIKGGSGPLSFSQCSIERWKGVFIRHSSGSATAVDFTNSYFENYPGTAASSPLTGYYDSGFVVVNPYNLTVTGCNINLKGIRRFLNATGGTVENLISTGNRINYSAGSSTTCQFVYYATAIKSAIFNDAAYLGFSETGGSYETSYIGGISGHPPELTGYDPITKEPVSGYGNYTPIFSGASGTSGSFASNTTGYYTLNGLTCTAHIRSVGISNTGGWSGNVRISLPFTCKGLGNMIGTAKLRIYGDNGVYHLIVNEGDKFGSFYWAAGGSVPSNEYLQWSQMSTSSSGRIFATITYTIDPSELD